MKIRGALNLYCQCQEFFITNYDGYRYDELEGSEVTLQKNDFDSELALLINSNPGYFYLMYDEDWGFFKSKLFYLTNNLLGDIMGLKNNQGGQTGVSDNQLKYKLMIRDKDSEQSSKKMFDKIKQFRE